MERLTFGEHIPKVQDTVIGYADDIAGVRFVDKLAALGQKGYNVIWTNFFVVPRDLQAHTALKAAGAHAYKGNTITVRGIHIGLHFKYYTSELWLFGMDDALKRLTRPGRWRLID